MKNGCLSIKIGPLLIILQFRCMKIKQILSINSVFVHMLFWLAVWTFFYLFFSFSTYSSEYVIWFATLLLPVTMLTTYYVVYRLIPKYLLTKKYRLFVLYSFYTFIVSADLIVLVIFFYFLFMARIQVYEMPFMNRNFIFVLILVYMVVVAVSFVSLLHRNFGAVSKNKALENKILEAQLKLKEQQLDSLKKQLHPHFLFNTLNTIYGMAMKGSIQTPEIIIKLSNLLDYILYQIKKPQVNLSDEISHIKEYIDLEKFRFRDSLEIDLKLKGDSSGVEIAPMLLFPFVENAFKHGRIKDGKLLVNIEIEVFSDGFEFNIGNSSSSDKENKQGGIGLENIRKRLEMLYPLNHRLIIEDKDTWYEVQLRIENIN